VLCCSEILLKTLHFKETNAFGGSVVNPSDIESDVEAKIFEGNVFLSAKIHSARGVKSCDVSFVGILMILKFCEKNFEIFQALF
jgi:hypothetical protein